MKFKIVYSKPTFANSILIYRPEEFSFDTDPTPISSFASVLVDDLNLEVDVNGKIVSIWGLCPHTRWRDLSLLPPKGTPGEIIIVPETPFQRGISFQLTTARTYLPTYVDRSQGWVVVRGPSKSSSAVTIFPGVVFEIGHQGEFCALWLHPQQGIAETGEHV